MVYRIYCKALYHSQTRRHMIMWYNNDVLVALNYICLWLIIEEYICGMMLKIQRQKRSYIIWALVATKPVFRVSDKARLKPGSSATDWNFGRRKFRYDTLQLANNQGADQTARMHRLVCAFVVRKPPKTGFLSAKPIWNTLSNTKASCLNYFASCSS